MPFKNTSSVTCFLQLGLPQTSPFSYEHLSGLIHQQGQHPHDPVLLASPSERGCIEDQYNESLGDT